MFRFRKIYPITFCPMPIQVEQKVSNFDANGVESISFVSVSAQSVIDSLPRPSEYTLVSQIQAGNLNPVSLEDFEVSHLDASVSSDIINSLNADTNENT